MKLIFSLLTISFIFIQCENCKDYDCITPPPFFTFELLDKDSKANLIVDGTIEAADVVISNLADDSVVDFRIEGENNELIVIYDIGWQTEKVTYNFAVADLAEFTFFVDAENVSENCCSFTRIHEAKVEGIEFELGDYSYHYQILVD